MCDRKTPVRVRIQPDLDVAGRGKWETVLIDACIAPIVRALQAAHIDMRGSCCGHDDSEGYIYLADGRALLVLPREQADWYFKEGIPLLRRGEEGAPADRARMG